MKKVVIIGDSISQGIGKKKINYSNYLNNKLGSDFDVYNLAYTGTTIEYAIELIDEINNIKPDIIIIMYGNVDAQIRPNVNGERYKLNHLIPRRYKQNGMLDPRPFYSKKWYRYVPDRIDNFFRKILRTIIHKIQGNIQLVSIDKFMNSYDKFLKNLDINTNNIYIVSTIRLDEKYYPQCLEQYKIYNEKMKQLAYERNANYIDLFGYIDKLLEVHSWDTIFYKDHYHPNDFGYQLIANLLANTIKFN